MAFSNLFLHQCAACHSPIAFRWDFKNLPFCKTCLSYLRPMPEPLFPDLHAAFYSIGVTHPILRHWKKHAHSVFEDRIFQSAQPVLDRLRRAHLTQPWDMIIPIPQRDRRAFHLGGGPARRIAFRIQRELQIPVQEILLRSDRAALRQAQKSLHERFESTLEFQIRDDMEIGFSGKRILLVDDLMTSGQTIKQSTQTLRDVGFGDVCVFVLGYRPHLSKGET